MTTPLDSYTFVALDLETTGVDPKSDHIIEVGAVKFSGGTELGTFSRLVNPHRKLPKFIVELTGITQSDVDEAGEWDDIAPELEEFLGDAPIIGHNVSFDASFLRSHGVKPASVLDTLTMAEVALPAGPEYSLGRLSRRFELSHDNPHRALSDALVTRDLFQHLLSVISELGTPQLEQIKALGSYAQTPLSFLAQLLLEDDTSPRLPTSDSMLGVDPKELSLRLRAHGKIPNIESHKYSFDNREISAVIPEVFGEAGLLESTLDGFETRPEQLEMAEAVTSALQNETHLVVEAGTGVGKSLAYLIPALLHSIRNGSRVLVSTNTINLQEQLVGKDIEIAKKAVTGFGLPTDVIQSAPLKGRSNYLCFKRWQNAVLHTEPNEIESRVLSKLLVWLQETETGDRSEISLGRSIPLFSRFSSQGAITCPSNEGPCFLRTARNKANNSNVIVVNHALLMSDIAMGGGLLPDHDVLIVDEAHHLVSAATNHLGFSLNQFLLETEIRRLTGNRGILSRLARTITENEVNPLDASTNLSLETVEQTERALESLGQLFEVLDRIEIPNAYDGNSASEIRITESVRTQPLFSEIEIVWENTNLILLGLSEKLGELIEKSEKLKVDSAAGLILDAYSVKETIEQAVGSLREALPEPKSDNVYWLRKQSNNRGVVLNGAPLDVSSSLRDSLFHTDRTVVLTGATITHDKSFERFRSEIGLDQADELILGSPYNFEKNALIAVPEDIPQPGTQGYGDAVSDALVQVARNTNGRTLALFTSISALDAARKAITPVLAADGIRVIGQGADGSPARIMRMLAEETNTIALGTSSLWEGVDLEGESLDSLVMVRLPFPVPSDPIVAARSEQFEDGFNEFSIPEAVQKFRQGFGRLIRSKTDRGVFAILDSRIISKRYGVKFQRSIPRCTVKRVSAENLGSLIASWHNGNTN